MQNLLANWRTTSLGITAMSGATIHLIFQVKHGTADESAWTIWAGAIVFGLGLLFSRDSAKSAQDHAALTADLAATKEAVRSGDTTHLTNPDTSPKP